MTGYEKPWRMVTIEIVVHIDYKTLVELFCSKIETDCPFGLGNTIKILNKGQIGSLTKHGRGIFHDNKYVAVPCRDRTFRI